MAIPSSRKKPHMSVKVVTNTELAMAGSILSRSRRSGTNASTNPPPPRLAVMAKATTAAGGRIWLMTGTPLLNHPGELWNVLRAAALEKVHGVSRATVTLAERRAVVEHSESATVARIIDAATDLGLVDVEKFEIVQLFVQD